MAVPAAAGDDLAAELAPVFASLEAFEAEAEAVRRESARQADAHVAAGREEVARVSEGWRARAEAERARAAAERRRRAGEEASALEERGRVAAERMREHASRRTPELVAEIVACVERGIR